MSESRSDAKSDRVRFHYIKSPAFHTIHTDGGIGGLTPSGNFHLALYAERFPIPTLSEHLLTGSGPGPEVPESRVVRDGVVRELLVDVVFDYRAAVALRQWLEANISQVELVFKEAQGRVQSKPPEAK